MANYDEVLAKVKAIVEAQLGEGIEFKVRDGRPWTVARYAGDLGADSLDRVMIAQALESEFDMTIPGEDQIKLVTIEDTVNYLVARST